MITLLLCCAAVDRGDLSVCLDGRRDSTGNDVDIEVAGTVIALDDTPGECSRSVVVDDGLGTVLHLGIVALDADGGDITPDMGVAVGDVVHAVYRYRMVWGDVAGFALTRDGALGAAADEGAWGGALAPDDLPGLAVTPGDVVATERGDCLPVEGHSLVFTGDDTVEVVPVSSSSVDVDGSPLSALAVAAWGYGEPTGCDMSDTTDVYAFVVTH